jgi:hypothetical protein
VLSTQWQDDSQTAYLRDRRDLWTLQKAQQRRQGSSAASLMLLKSRQAQSALAPASGGRGAAGSAGRGLVNSAFEDEEEESMWEGTDPLQQAREVSRRSP